MGSALGPNLIIDSLILYVDPANVKSNEGGVIMADMKENYVDNTLTSAQMSIGGNPKVITSNGDGGNFRYYPAGGSGSLIDWATTEWTISCWGLRDNSTARENRMWDLTNAGNGHLRLTLDSTPDLNFRPAGGSGYSLISGGTSTTGVWYNIVITKACQISGGSAVYTMYNNGVQVATNTSSSLTTESAFTYVRIMRSADDDQGDTVSWDGDFGPFSIYSKVLTAAEVLQNYNALKSRFI
jgi:hypothetical protein